MTADKYRHREPKAWRSIGGTEQSRRPEDRHASLAMTTSGRPSWPARLTTLTLLAALSACAAPPPPRVVYRPAPLRPAAPPVVSYRPLPPAPAPTPEPAEPALPSSIRPEPPPAPEAPVAASAPSPVQKARETDTPAVPLMGFRPMRGQRTPGA